MHGRLKENVKCVAKLFGKKVNMAVVVEL